MVEFNATDVVASSAGHRVLLMESEGRVWVRSLAERSVSTPLETTFGKGGRRVALSDELDAVLAGAYYDHGLALYSCRTGREIWRRKDIKKIQDVQLARDGITAYCGRDGASLLVLDLRTGETTSAVPAASAMYQSKFDPVHFLDGAVPQLVDNRDERVMVPRTTFAFLDVVFAPGRVCTSESGGPVRCFDVRSGQELWRYQPAPEHHVLRLGYHESTSCVLGIERQYVSSDRSKQLVRLSLQDGSLVDSLDIGSTWSACFALAGDVLVTTNGTVCSTTDGAVIPIEQIAD